MIQMDHMVENHTTMVERKLTGIFGHAKVEIPFDEYNTFINKVIDELDDYDINIDRLTLMENPQIYMNFLTSIKECGDDLSSLSYYNPDVGTIFHAEIKEATRILKEKEAEEKRIADLKAAEELATKKTNIRIAVENKDKALAILELAGLI